MIVATGCVEGIHGTAGKHDECVEEQERNDGGGKQVLVAQPQTDEGLHPDENPEHHNAGYHVMHKHQLPKHAIGLLPVPLSHQIAHARHNAAHHGGEEHGDAPDDQRVVAVIGHHLERHESKDEYLVALLEEEIFHLVDEDLLGLLYNFGILASHLVSHSGGCSEPGIGLPDFPVQNGGMDEAVQQFDGHPQIEVAYIIDQSHLYEGLDERGRLEIGCHHIVALVGIKEDGVVVDEIAYQGGGEEGKEGKIDDAIREDSVPEDEGKEDTDQDACCQHKTADVAVKAAKDRYDSAYLVSVPLGNGLIEGITYRGSHTQLCQVEEA